MPFATTDTSHSPHRPVIVIALLIIGILAWFSLFAQSAFLTFGPLPPPYLLGFVLSVAILLFIPPVRAMLELARNAVRSPSDHSRFATSITLGFASAAYLYATAIQQLRIFKPFLHDEFSYLIQAHQLAHFRLWMPAHPLAPFFDSFQLITQPVYASAYFPGTALLYIPGIWLHLPPWITSLAISAAIIALLYRIVTELMDGVAGLLSVLLLLSCQMFRELTFMTMAQLPLVLFGLIPMLAWLKWRSTRRPTWAIAIGAAIGLSAITRPVDALCYLLPLAIGFTFDLRSQSHARKAILFAILGVLPFAAIQLTSNVGITGHVFETPFRLYADRDYPNTNFGFHPFDPSAKPLSPLRQKQNLYQQYIPLIAIHQPRNAIPELVHHRLPLLLSLGSSTPFPLLLILMPISLVAMNKPRAAMLSALPLFAVLYTFYVFFFPHYVVTAAPAIILAVLIGAAEFANIFGTWKTPASIGITLIITGLSIASLPQFDSTLKDEMFDAPLIHAVDTQLAPLKNAVVLFRYDPARNLDEEPVYNADVAWPDDAPIIRAHDLGPSNIQIFRYYADHQPDRTFYRFDESDRSLHPLGTARQLANMSP